MTDHRTSLSKFRKIEITSGICADHQGIKLEKNNSRNSREHKNTLRVYSVLLNEQWVTEEIKAILEINEDDSTTYQNLWDSTNAVIRGTFKAKTAYILRYLKGIK